MNTKLILIFSLCLFSFFSVAYGNSNQNELCQDGFRFVKTMEPWSYAMVDPSKFDSQSERKQLCTTYSCEKNGIRNVRKRCFLQGIHPNTIELHIKDDTSNADSRTFSSTFREIVISPTDSCFNQCKPRKLTLLGAKTGERSGLARNACQECFKGRLDEKRIGVINLPQANKKLYSGMNCYEKCQAPKGEFQSVHTYSEECQSCVGFSGKKGMRFKYLITKDGECFEYDPENQRSSVPLHLCDSSLNPTKTKYHEDDEFSFQSFLFGMDPDCFEVDEKSMGGLYKKEVSKTFCDPDSVFDGKRKSGKLAEEDVKAEDSVGSGASSL